MAFIDNQTEGFLVAWPSENKIIGTVGFQAYGQNEKAFVESYLHKYPNSLEQ